jgi:hypothetical protein
LAKNRKLSELSLIQKLGLVLTIIGAFTILLYLLYYTFFKECNYQNSDCRVHYFIVLSIFVGGILLLIGDSILLKYNKELIDKILDDAKLIKYIETKVEENQELNLQALVEENQQDNVVNDFDTVNDTVIVPVSFSINEIKNSNVYECPNNRTFKQNLNYIAFYKSKQIVGYGELNKEPYDDGKMKIFEIKKFEPLAIKHLDRYAYVQNKRYCNFKQLQSAKTTEDLK